MEDAFESIMNEAAEEFANAEVFSDWMPPDGDYTVLLLETKKGAVDKEGQKYGWWRLPGTIIDDTNPELGGKEFTVGYYTTKALGILKGAVSTLAGRTVTALTEVPEILATSAGRVVIVSVTTAFNKKANREFTNSRIQKVLPEQNVEAEAPPEPVTTEAVA